MIGNQIEIPSLSCSPISDDESVCIIMKLHSVILEICLEGWVVGYCTQAMGLIQLLHFPWSESGNGWQLFVLVRSICKRWMLKASVLDSVNIVCIQERK